MSRTQGACIVAGLAGLAAIDVAAAYRLTRGQLRLPVEVAELTSVCPDDEPEVTNRLVDTMRDLGAQLDPTPPCDAEAHLSHERLLRLSPYPAFLGEDEPDGGPAVASARIRTRGGRTLQLTLAYGVAHTTPSIFVPPADGDETGGGEHRPTYFFVHQMSPTGAPHLLHASWESREVGGIENLREAALAFTMLVAELMWIALIVGAYRLGRRRR